MRPRSWSQGWKKGGFVALLSGLTSPRSTPKSSPDESTSSSPGIHAKGRATPATKAEPNTRRGYGRTCGGSFAWFDLDSCSWKTFQLTLLGPSESFSETFPKSGGLRNGTAFRRSQWAPPTNAIVSSCLLPTPAANRYGYNQGGEASDGPIRYSLEQLARKGMLTSGGLTPTPNARDWKDAGTTQGNRKSPNLGTMAVRAGEANTPSGLIPTPTSRDCTAARRHGYMENANPGTTLTDWAFELKDCPDSRGETSRCLNPRFVEWLMGIPIGWLKTTCVCAIETINSTSAGTA